MITTNTAYLVGLNAKVLTCTVTHDPNGQTTTLDKRDPHDRTFDAWARELLIRVRGAINTLGLLGGFTISFDHKPPSHARPDLAIVAACLVAAGHDLGDTSRTLFLGEFAFTDGRLLSTRGVLPILENVEGFSHAFVPASNAIEAGANTNRIVVQTIANAHDLIDPSSETRKFALRSMDQWEPEGRAVDSRGLSEPTMVALSQAALSGKNVLLVGTNAWNAAKVFHGLLPKLSGSEARGVTCLHSMAGILTDGKIPTVRPFRAPHHTVSERGLVGSFDRPGEVSLACHGTLVLDHVAMFKRTGLEWLKNAVRTNRVTCMRGDVTIEWPARCRIVATVYPDELRFLTLERVAFLDDYVRVDV